MRSVFATRNWIGLTEIEAYKKSEELVQTIKTQLSIKWIAAGFHLGTASKIYHVHIVFTSPSTFASARLLKVCAGAHLEPMRGTAAQALKYLGKDGKMILEEGDPPHQGRTDDNEDFAALVQAIKDGADEKKVLCDFPKIVISHTQGVSYARSILQAPPVHFKDHPLYKWQSDVYKCLLAEPDDRLIYFVVDRAGSRGKTWFCRMLMHKHGAAYFTNAKSADVAHAYHGERIVVFDLTRSVEGAVNYSIIEQVKNGVLFSPKYGSITKEFDPPNVCVFMNFEVDETKLTRNRICTFDLDEIDGACDPAQ